MKKEVDNEFFIPLQYVDTTVIITYYKTIFKRKSIKPTISSTKISYKTVLGFASIHTKISSTTIP